MANTYTQIHIQFVIVVKYRASVIAHTWKDQLHQYIAGISRNQGHKVLAINSMPDHLHMLIGFRPNESMSHFMQVVKANSSKWINKEKLTRQRFEWQSGFGAFSYHKALVPTVSNYIRNQEEHHRRKTFREEYIQVLNEFEVEHDSKYLFSPLIE